MTYSRLQKIFSGAMSFLLAFSVLNHSLFAINYAQADGESFINGKTFYDVNKNGVNDLGDSVLPFLKVSLYQDSTLVQGPNSIDNSGNYSFTIITPGTYHVNFTNLPLNYSFSAPNIGGDDTTDSDVNNSGLGVGSTDDIVLVGGETVANVDAGAYVDNVIVGDYVWFDNDNDGIQDISESGAEAINVELQDQNTNTTLGSDSTDGTGHYGISATLPACIGPNEFWESGDSNMTCSNVNVSGGYYELTFTTGPDCEINSVAIGLVGADSNPLFYNSCGSSEGHLRNSTSYNFRVGPEVGTGQAQLTFNESGSSLGIGNIMVIYQKNRVAFSNVPPGQSFSSSDSGSDDTVDSDVDTGGFTNVLELGTGEIYNNIDAGICNSPCTPPAPSGSASIGNFIWNDSNSNGLQDMGELGASGVSITLYRTSDNQFTGSTSSDINGAYSITSIPAGTYYIQVGSIPPGYQLTINDTNSNSNDSEDSDINPMNGFSTNFSLTDAQVKTDLDVGIVSSGGGGGPSGSGSISGVVFSDNNNNGIHEPGDGEGFWPGVNISLYRSSDDSQVSGQGSTNDEPYVFNGLIDGDYYIIFSNIPPDANFSPQNQGSDEALDSDVDPDGRTDIIHIENGETVPYVGAGVHGSGGGGGGGGGGGEGCEGSCGHIDIELFGDTNENGTLDEGEIHDVDGAQLHIEGDNDTDITMPFDPEGRVSGDVNVGTYTLTILLPEGFEITGGENPFIIEVTDGSDNSYRRGAIYEDGDEEEECEEGCGRILLHVFTDTNNNGTQQTWEPSSASGTTVHLQGGDIDEIVSLAESGDVGGNVPNGTYTFTITPPTGSIVTGGSNPVISVVTTNSDTTVTRGIYITSGSSGGSSGGGSVIYGGGGSSSSGGSSNWSSSSSSSSSRSSTSSNRNSANNNTTTNSPTTTSPTNQPSSTLPPVTPIFTPCLITGGISPIDFYDSNLAETDYLSSIIFQNNHANRLIHGDGNGSFAGNQPMTRFELLKVALGSNCVAGGNFITPNSSFNDVSTDSSEQSRIIGEAHNRGIVQGHNNQFYPNQPVTLGELIKIVLGSSAYFPNGQPVQNLVVTELGVTEPTFIQPIEYAKLLGILEQSGPINQNEIVTRDQMAIIIARYIRAMNELVINQ